MYRHIDKKTVKDAFVTLIVLAMVSDVNQTCIFHIPVDLQNLKRKIGGGCWGQHL
jgi:hypothetical protein